MRCIRGRVLDFGCGYGADVDFLLEKGVDAVGYDPHYAPRLPEGPFDTILCHYVLNVLMRQRQSEILMEVSELLSPTGAAYFSVRRDLRRPGFRLHYIHREHTYQTNVVLPFETVVRTKYCEIYRYRPYSRTMADEPSSCPFCAPSSEITIITESAQAVAFFDKYPVTEGHALVVPKRHISSYFNLAEPEQKACWMLINRVQPILSERYHPDGFNVGINVSRAAGQTIDHAHVHVIPRYEGDTPDPVGGVRKVIPGKGDYLSGDK